jgi:adenylylsulfate kinase
MKILIFGLPGSGKTTLAKLLVPMFNAVHLNGDKIRKELNDWDFSEQGRLKQSIRLKILADKAVNENRKVIADFVCPTEYKRKEFNADYKIWMNTIKVGRYEDTNKMFEEPKNPDFIVTHFEADMWAYLIKNDIYK